MSTLREPVLAMVVCSALSARWERLDDPAHLLAPLLGPALRVIGPLAFTDTDYYDRELGTPITRLLLAFERLVPQDALADIKTAVANLERCLARPDGRRLVNLDPGLLTMERLVLASGKNFPHRVYLGQGVFADLTLTRSRLGWVSQAWTFPDYAGAELQKHLTELRKLYHKRLSGPRKAGAK